MGLAKYNLKSNKLFRDKDHPSVTSLKDFSSRNEDIFKIVTLKELENLMPDNPTWMHGARACSALAQAICMKYGIESIVPSDSNLINGIAVPTNIHFAGWYVNSAIPGQKGVSIIDGHVSGNYQNAIFAGLADIEKGDLIRIQFGDETWKEFQIFDFGNYVTDATMEHLLSLQDGISNQLNLITCSGVYDDEANSYDERLVVRAGLVGL